MQVLVHLGLNKCASTFVQASLLRSQDLLAERRVDYHPGDGQAAHYGVSKQYGFGPDDGAVRPVDLKTLIGTSRARGLRRQIISSEYLSLYNPRAVARFSDELARADCRVRFVLFSRDVGDWIRSLFNQYVKTVDSGRYLNSIDAFVDQILANRSIDIARRAQQWIDAAEKAGQDFTHYRIDRGAPPDAVLRPFAVFAGQSLIAPDAAAANRSLGADALYRVGQLRRQVPGAARDRELSALLAGSPAPKAAPEGYLTIGANRLSRLRREIIEPYERLGWCALPERALEAAL